jgi:hypothetical protein
MRGRNEFFGAADFWSDYGRSLSSSRVNRAKRGTDLPDEQSSSCRARALANLKLIMEIHFAWKTGRCL